MKAVSRQRSDVRFQGNLARQQLPICTLFFAMTLKTLNVFKLAISARFWNRPAQIFLERSHGKKRFSQLNQRHIQWFHENLMPTERSTRLDINRNTLRLHLARILETAFQRVHGSSLAHGGKNSKTRTLKLHAVICRLKLWWPVSETITQEKYIKEGRHKTFNFRRHA